MSFSSLGFALPSLPSLQPNDFERAAALLRRRAGIMLGAHKRDMAERNLALQAKSLGLETVSEYLDYLASQSNVPAWQDFINSFTINHTVFFREAHHFDVLASFVQSRQRPLSIWSAACSTGEEIWSIAMTLRETLSNPDYQVKLLGTDIDTEALAAARNGIYTLDRARSVPEERLKKYFHRGVGQRAGMVRVKDSLRSMVSFRNLNLVGGAWDMDEKHDVIFCRNTLIYFEKETQGEILRRMASVMKPGGILFAGHSENLTYVTTAFRLLGQTVYEVNPGRQARSDLLREGMA